MIWPVMLIVESITQTVKDSPSFSVAVWLPAILPETVTVVPFPQLPWEEKVLPAAGGHGGAAIGGLKVHDTPVDPEPSVVERMTGPEGRY